MLSKKWATDIILLGVILLAFYTLWLGSYPLFTPDEGRYSEVAREMVATGDYITPRVNGVAFLDKPVLYYWLQAAAIHLFGLKEWALRFFPALLGVIGCLVTYVCGRHLFSRRTGLIAAAALGTNPLYFAGAHYANMDLEVAVWISACLLFFVTGVHSAHRARTWFLLASYVCAALAFLTKGMIGFVFPGVIVGVWGVLASRGSAALGPRYKVGPAKNIHLIPGLLLILLIVSPWYYFVQQANPEFLHYFFVTQQVTRFLSGASFNNIMPFWFYIPVTLAGFFPWSIFLLLAVYKNSQRVWHAPQQHSVALFLLLWIGIVLVFFSIPHSKIVTYILPIFAPIALLVGNEIDRSWQIKPMRILFASCLTIGTLILFAALCYVPYYNQDSAKQLTTQLKPVLQPQDEVVNYLKFYQDVPLYLERRITLVADWDSPTIAKQDNWMRELSLGRDFQDTRDWLINETTFWQRWHKKSHRVFVFVAEKNLKQFKLRAQPYFLIGENHQIYLLSNQPLLSTWGKSS